MLTTKEIKTLDKIADSKHGAKCACCGRTYQIWYAGTLQIARIYCACETPPVGANRMGVLSVYEQITD